MATLLWILFWLIIGLVGLLVVILVSPIHLRMTATSEPAQSFRLELRLFSARLPRLIAMNGLPESKPKPDEPEEPKPKPKKKDKKPRKKWQRPGNVAKLLPEVPKVMGDTLRGIHIDQLHAHGKFGLGDPADTGTAFGMLAPLIYIPKPGKYSLMLAPDFDMLGFAGNATAALHFTPIRLSWPAIRFAWRAFVWPR